MILLICFHAANNNNFFDFLSGDIIGRQVIPLRICTCPKRDMENDEKQIRKNQTVVNGSGNGSSPLSALAAVGAQAAASQQASDAGGGGKVRLNPSSKRKFWCFVSSEENFKILKGVAEGLEKKDGQNIQSWNEQVSR